jgi:hypothetical protein
MNTSFLRKVFERMHDRTFASVIAAAGAGTDGEVSERTARNWLGKQTTPDPETLERLASGSQANFKKALEEASRRVASPHRDASCLSWICERFCRFPSKRRR